MSAGEGAAAVGASLQQLDGDVAVELGVEGGVDDAHAAFADDVSDDVAADAGALLEAVFVGGLVGVGDHLRAVVVGVRRARLVGVEDPRRGHGFVGAHLARDAFGEVRLGLRQLVAPQRPFLQATDLRGRQVHVATLQRAPSTVETVDGRNRPALDVDCSRCTS